MAHRDLPRVPAPDAHPAAQPGVGRLRPHPADHLPRAVRPAAQERHRRRPGRRRLLAHLRPGPAACSWPSSAPGFAGFGIIQELREGVIERQRVTPARRLSLILGRTLSNMVTIGVQATVLVARRDPVRPRAVVGRRRRLDRPHLPAGDRDLGRVVRDGADPQGRGRVRAVHPGRLAAAAAALRRAAADDAWPRPGSRRASKVNPLTLRRRRDAQPVPRRLRRSGRAARRAGSRSRSAPCSPGGARGSSSARAPESGPEQPVAGEHRAGDARAGEVVARVAVEHHEVGGEPGREPPAARPPRPRARRARW